MVLHAMQSRVPETGNIINIKHTHFFFLFPYRMFLSLYCRNVTQNIQCTRTKNIHNTRAQYHYQRCCLSVSLRPGGPSRTPLRLAARSRARYTQYTLRHQIKTLTIRSRARTISAQYRTHNIINNIGHAHVAVLVCLSPL
jgi:hypothetical protein